MNARQLEKLGVPQDCVRSAITTIQNTTKGGLRGKQVKETVKDVVSQPGQRRRCSRSCKLSVPSTLKSSKVVSLMLAQREGSHHHLSSERGNEVPQAGTCIRGD